MERLCAALAIPDKYTCVQGTITTGMEALMVLLRRLSYPNRLCDLVQLFGRSQSELSFIFNTVRLFHVQNMYKFVIHICIHHTNTLFLQVIDDIYDRFSHLLNSFDLVWLDPHTFAAAIKDKGSPLSQCFGFIDGTVRPIARPTVNQRIMYSGHKRVHCLKFQVRVLYLHMYMNRCMVGDDSSFQILQSVTTPNGLIVHMFGPVEGRRHDAFMLSVSGLPNKLRAINQPNGQPYVLYGAPAYGLSQNIVSPYRGQQLTQAEHDFNRAMSAVHVSVQSGHSVKSFNSLPIWISRKIRKFFYNQSGSTTWWGPFSLTATLVCMGHRQQPSLAYLHQLQKLTYQTSELIHA